MGDHTATRNLQLHHNPVFDVSLNVQGGSKYIDDDGRPKRTGKLYFCNGGQSLIWLQGKHLDNANKNACTLCSC